MRLYFEYTLLSEDVAVLALCNDTYESSFSKKELGET